MAKKRIPGAGGPNLPKPKKKPVARKKKPRAKVVRGGRNKSQSLFGVVWGYLSLFIPTFNKGKATSKSKRKNKKKDSNSKFSKFRRWFFTAPVLAQTSSVLLTLLIMFSILMTYFAYDMPSISELNAPREKHGIQIKDSKGNIIARYGDIYGDYLGFDDLPTELVGAVLATEDRNFFYHFGLDPIGIARAMFVNIKSGRFSQGGSTITQQLAKNIFLSSERTLKRKIQEMFLSFWLESKFSKQEILSIYLNKVYLGAGNYGVDAASRHYFGKPAKQMNLGESALIAGLLKAPSRYAPTSSEERSKGRAQQVLLNMVDAGRLSIEEAENTIKKLKFTDKKHRKSKSNGNGDGKDKDIKSVVNNTNKYFSDWVLESITKHIGEIKEDLIVETTMQPKMQQFAERAIARNMTSEIQEKSHVSQAVLVSMRANGEVVALIGGLDHNKSEYNRATQAKRQPGSAFKPIIYLTAMENGYDPESLVEDKPIYIKGWRPKNYNGKYRGLMSIKQALTHSVNTIAVQLLQATSIKKVIKTAKRLGVESKIPHAPSIALGSNELTPIEMTTAYAHFASGGYAVKPYGIKKIIGKESGRTLYQRKKPQKTLVIKKDAVGKMNSMLNNVIQFGTGKAARIGRPAAGKTGTTSEYKDAWFVGFTGNIATAVWVGNDDATKMNKVTGGSIPARIWQNYMYNADRQHKTASLNTHYQRATADLPWLVNNKKYKNNKGEYNSYDSNKKYYKSKNSNGKNHKSSNGKVDLDNDFWDKLFTDKNNKKPKKGRKFNKNHNNKNNKNNKKPANDNKNNVEEKNIEYSYPNKKKWNKRRY